ncbi:MAG: crossover junction endodeoxyribonuclease RuvC [Patescibacteria group bacterium]
MRILGIDPGYERLGIAILEKTSGKEKVVFSECFKTSAKLKFEERIFLIGIEIKNIIKKYKPEILAIETLFLNTNQKTAMRVAEVRGVIIYEGISSQLKIFEVSPLQIKIAITGYGRADKKQILKMVEKLVDLNYDKKQQESQKNDDELDAIAIALTAFAYIKKY